MKNEFEHNQAVIEAVIIMIFNERYAEIIEHIKNDGHKTTLKYVYPPIKLRLAKNNIFINLADEQLFKDLIQTKFTDEFGD